MIICHCRFISYNKCTSLVGDTDNGRDHAYVGMEELWEISEPSAPFCCEIYNAFKKSI